MLKEIRSFNYAFKGLSHLWAERHFKIHLVLGTLAVALGFYLNIDRLEWLAVILAITFVLVSEAINSVVEKMVDYISLEKHPAAKLIKDMSAGMVLISALSSIAVGVLVFLF